MRSLIGVYVCSFYRRHPSFKVNGDQYEHNYIFLFEPGYDKTGLWGDNVNFFLSLQIVFRYLIYNCTKFHDDLSFLNGKIIHLTSLLVLLHVFTSYFHSFHRIVAYWPSENDFIYT